MATTTFQYHTELIDGVEVEKALPKILHIRIQKFLILYFEANLPRFLEAFPELNVLCGSTGDRLVPDVVVTDRNANYLNGDLADSLVVAIEIMSPGQTLGSLLSKCDRLLNTVTPVCWVIWPEKRQAWTYTTSELTPAVETLQALDGRIVVPLAEMWKVID